MSGEKTSSRARRERLAKALKSNIARRKAQARGRAPDAPAEPGIAPPSDLPGSAPETSEKSS